MAPDGFTNAQLRLSFTDALPSADPTKLKLDYLSLPITSAGRFWCWGPLGMMTTQIEKHDQCYGDGNPKDKTTETLETRRHGGTLSPVRNPLNPG